ncbi:hypothetical protein FB45DRAFT_998488 [Roridomyces roridus]|uniref:RING-type domain-containing protein n=1 Tax=Roridomyces roridus TaxID=1738132 RepID=A0AAD7CF88_9AGAR|nr:hypothetical protein FB45DRAFT_998488 [Roridomyces roridus]
MLSISGTVPGLLDKQQSQRLLRRPSSTLSFASFDPRTALGDHGWDLRGLSLNEELYRPKRVVIETTCGGEASTWRFVPKARLEEGVVDEGQWPRVIEICGQQVECSQDQFSIYCLDPAYDCLVRAPPQLTAITKAESIPRVPKQPLGKHRMSSAEPCPEMPPSKKAVSVDEEEEVAEMIVDDDAAADLKRGERSKKFREEMEKNRRERREKGARRLEKLASKDTPLFDFSAASPELSPTGEDLPDSAGKRKVSSLFDSLRTQDDTDYYAEDNGRNTVNYSPTNAAKRSRLFSPGAAKRDLDARRLGREKQKRERRERKLDQRKQQRFHSFLQEIYSEVPDGSAPVNGNVPSNQDSDSDSDEEAEAVDEEAERLAFIAESRRKLAELEADRPLWEQAAKRRQEREREEQEEQRAKAAERRTAEARKADEERRARAERERQETREKEQERARDAEAKARRQREKQQRNERWAYGPWTTQRALERYKTLSDLFDATKFTQDEPVTFDVVPWPVLHSPVSFTVEDIDWAAVEGFFNAIKPHMRSQDFVSFVEKSHRRFHPDRWRSRGLLKNIADEAERGCMEVDPLVSLYITEPLHDSDSMTEARDSALRRTRSAGDVPASSSTIRSPDPVHLRNSESHLHAADLLSDALAPPTLARSRNSAGLVLDRARIPEDSEHSIDIPPLLIPNPTPPTPPAPPPPLPRHNTSIYSRLMTFFGYGRGASRARKLLVSLWYNMAWGFVQVVVIITMLAIAAHTESTTMLGRSEWVACDRPLGTWACIYVVRIVFSSSLTYWGWLRDRKALSSAPDAENANERPSRNAAPNSATLAHPPPIGTSSTSGTAEGQQPPLQHSVLYSRLSILSSLFTLSWFLTAHILQYTSIHTCRFSSPHLWWLTFGILCIMYLVVLEVIILGVVVFLIAPIIFLIWNIFLMCLGRHPLQNPTMIRPDIGKLSPSVVDRIPLVMYIPPPPDAPPGSIKIPEAVYSYPPKPPPAAKPKRRFKFIRRRSNKDAASDVPERTPKDMGKPQTWEDHWEYSGYPFVMLEGNRAACAICLMDFEEPKRIAEPESSLVPSTTGDAPSSATLVIEEVPAQVGEGVLKLEDAGEGAQPLRLLACGHVFHKTCLDPWLCDVSGRCPVCQRAVELPAPSKGK